MEINAGVSVVGSESNKSSLIDNGWYGKDENDTLGGTAYSETSYPSNVAKLTINGGNFSGGLNTVKNDDNGDLTIIDGHFSNSTQVPVQNWNVAVIRGGTFEASSSNDKTAICNGTYGSQIGQITISGGTFNTEYVLEKSVASNGDGSITITGGNFKNVSKGLVNTTGTTTIDKQNITISGGQLGTAAGKDAETQATLPSGKYVDSNGNVRNVPVYTPPTSYAITTPTAENGKITVSPTSATAGTKVTVTVTPDEGYELDTITATNGAGKEFQLTKNADGTYSYNQPTSAVTIKATFKKTVVAPKFTDVPALGDLADAVNYGVSKGFINGTSDTTFTPNGEVTRAQFAAFLYRLDGSHKVSTKASFDDISGDLGGGDFLDAINWSAANGIIKGVDDTHFEPLATVTREQAAAMLHRYEKSLTKTGTNTFTDVKSGAWYEDDINWGVANGIIQGYSDTTFGVGNNTTRGQAVQFIYRAEKQ